MANMKLRLFSGESNNSNAGRVGFINNRTRPMAMRSEPNQNDMRGENSRNEGRATWRDTREDHMEAASRMNRSELEANYAEMCMKHEMLKGKMQEMAPGFAEIADKVEPLVGVIEEVFPKVMAKAEKVLANPPKTWENYLEKGDIPAIIRMEGGEFMKVLEKADSVEDLTKEATHTVAAVMMYCLSD